MASHTSLEELLQAVEQQQANYLRSLRALHESLALQQQQLPLQAAAQQQYQAAHTTQPEASRRRPRADSRITVQDAPYTPPLRAMSGPTFTFSTDSGGVQHASQALPLPARRSTLDAPSPRPFAPSSPVPGALLPPDEELSFIPLLDQSTPPQQRAQQTQASSSPQLTQAASSPIPRTHVPLLPMRFTDDMLLQHLRDGKFGAALGKQLEDIREKRKADLDTALSFRDFAAYERELFPSATFEVYDVAADASAKKVSIDVDAAVKYYGGDGLFENPDSIVDAALVWDGIKEVNLDGSSVGRIT